jgi:biotin carboxylase
MRVLILSTTTGYQLRAFSDAAEQMGVELAFATNHCDRLEDPWRDRAVPVKFHQEAKSVAAIARSAAERPLNGVIPVGDGPVALAALTAERLGLPGNPPAAAQITRSKLLMREALDRAGLPVPWFFHVPVDDPPEDVLRRLHGAAMRSPFPCVVKPLALAASRGVMRADDERTFLAAFDRIRALLERRDVQVQRNAALRYVLVEGYLAGDEFALEGVVTDGELQTLALFDKPDPLEGPFFEETIYVTPSRLPAQTQAAIAHTVKAAVRAIGLRHGPVHAEVRVNPNGVYVLEVAARPIGGLCARALRFMEKGQSLAPLEGLLLRHAVGERVDGYVREERASGVMMIPVPRRGVFKRVENVEAGRGLPGIDDIVITAKPDQMLVPLPEGASYPGFIFASGDSAEQVERSLRDANAALGWVIERPVEVL